jgi:hypothetical protein
MKIIITESQYKILLEQQVSQVQVQYEDGSIKMVDYQKFYYGPDFKQYKWDGKKFVFDYSKIYPNWNSMNQTDRDKVIANRKRVKASGSYSQQPNLISLGLNEFNGYLKNVVWANLTFDNIVEVIIKLMEFLPPPYGGKANVKAAGVAHGVSYLLRSFLSKTTDDITSNFVNAMFKFFSVTSGTSVPLPPSSVVNIAKKIVSIYQKIKDKITKLTDFSALAEWLQVSLTFIVQYIGDQITGIIQTITENILSPIIKMFGQYSTTLSTYLSNAIQYLNKISSTLKSAKQALSYVKQQDPNAFT